MALQTLLSAAAQSDVTTAAPLRVGLTAGTTGELQGAEPAKPAASETAAGPDACGDSALGAAAPAGTPLSAGAEAGPSRSGTAFAVLNSANKTPLKALDPRR